ncbi:MAG: serine/threonine-protein kinase [Polyangiaceae bacterium]
MTRDDGDDQRTVHPSVPPGSSFGKYEVIRRLGEGGMGSVYEARHTELGRRVALKVLRSKLARNKTYLERFLREGRIAARLDHPHVVGVFDVGTESGSPFLVMEFLAGEDLDAHLSGRGPLETSEAVDILLPILSALDAAHGAGLVHRDLKPANIFLCRAAHGGFHPKLLDFGIAKPGTEEAAQLTGTAEVFGTPQYMAPEQVRRAKDAKPESDQYAMGVILYRAVVGKEAFELGDLSVYAILERVVGGTFPSPRRVRPDVDPGIERVILRAMAKDPKDRFLSVRAWARRSCRTRRRPCARRGPRRSRPRRRAPRR